MSEITAQGILNGLDALKDIIHVRSFDDVKILLLLAVLFSCLPLLLLLKGRGLQIYSGVLAGCIIGTTLGFASLPLAFIGGFVGLGMVVIPLYVIVSLLIFVIPFRIIYKTYPLGAWLYLASVILTELYGIGIVFYTIIY